MLRRNEWDKTISKRSHVSVCLCVCLCVAACDGPVKFHRISNNFFQFQKLNRTPLSPSTPPSLPGSAAGPPTRTTTHLLSPVKTNSKGFIFILQSLASLQCLESVSCNIFRIRCTSWFNSGSRIIENDLSWCFSYFYPLRGALTLRDKTNIYLT